MTTALTTLFVALTVGLFWFFIGSPITEFSGLRSEFNREEALFAGWRTNPKNVVTPDERKAYLRNTRDRYLAIAAKLLAFSESNRIAARLLSAIGFNPGMAGAAISACADELEVYRDRYLIFSTKAREGLKL